MITKSEYKKASKAKKNPTKVTFSYELQAISAPGRSDEPSAVDYLNRTNFVNAMGALISHERTEVPLTIGIYGEWGSGKSSMMKQLEYLLKGKHYVVNFNAWRYCTAEELWAALVGKVAKVIDKQLSPLMRLRFLLFSKDASSSRYKLSQLWDRFLAGVKKIENWLVNFILVIGLINLEGNESLKSFKDLPLNIIRESFPEILKLTFLILPILVIIYKIGRIVLFPFSTQLEVYEANLKTKPDDRKQMTQADLNVISSLFKRYKRSRNMKRAVVFLDDLDRCPPDKITDILEAVNLFFEGLPLVTVFGLNPKVVSLAVANKYEFMLNKDADILEKERFGRSFLQKIIHIPFQIPPVENFDLYLDSLMVQTGKKKDEASDRIIEYGREYLNRLSGLKKFKGYFEVFSINIAAWLYFHTVLRTSDDKMIFFSIIRLLYRLGLTSTQRDWLKIQSFYKQSLLKQLENLLDDENLGIFQFFQLDIFKLTRLLYKTIQAILTAQSDALLKEIEMEISDAKLLKEFSLSLEGNPRAIKRFINVYQLAKGINAQLPVIKQAPMVGLTTWLVLFQKWPIDGVKLYDEIFSNPSQHSELLEKTINNEKLPQTFRNYLKRHETDLMEIVEHGEGFKIAGCFSFYSHS